ncbi:MAG: hypothetical protein H7A48_14590 [Akkermansiaceae bacterium]|nr:hypothetical protein [Akkermansiaceae bacterium]
MKLSSPIFPIALAALCPLAAGGAPKSVGMQVSNSNRNDVLTLWHACYMASEGYENRIKWTGDYNGKTGSVSTAFVADVERRVNFFRALCGVPATVRVNTNSTVHIDPTDAHKPSKSTKKSSAAQESALMLVRNYDANSGSNPAITHDPAGGLTGWSKEAWNASAHGNIAFGLFGPGAITEYMVEEIQRGSATSYWNSSVGHRRWILQPGATNFATGDQPGTGPYRPPTNTLYISQRPGEVNENVDAGFVEYPAAGYFPAPVNSRFWSLSRDGADFSNASVSMKDASGRVVAVKGIKTSPTYGDPAIVWEVDSRAAIQNVTTDTKFSVTVSGIQGEGVPAEHRYEVILIDPERLTSNQALRGPKTVPAKAAAVVSTPQVPLSQARRVTTFVQRRGSWTENAEKKRKTEVIDKTGSAYPLVTKMSSFAGFGGVSGKKAFHLTFPTSYNLIKRGVPDQIFEIDREILPKSKAFLQFYYRRGFMTKASHLQVEVSRDGGLTWKSAGKKISGVSNTFYDREIGIAKIKLPKSSKPVRVRFRYYVTGTSAIFVHDDKSPTGIFIDDIKTRNCDWLEPSKTMGLPAAATSFKLSRASAGKGFRKKSKLMLGLRSMIGGHWFPYGPMKKVRVK